MTLSLLIVEAELAALDTESGGERRDVIARTCISAAVQTNLRGAAR